MSLYDKFKNFNYERCCRKRYKKFKNCSLPYPFLNKKRNTFEWVSYNKIRNDYNVANQIFCALDDLSIAGLTYDYEANFFDYNRDQLINHISNSHSHDFNGVVQALYEYPEFFKIPDNCLKEYSEIKVFKTYTKLFDFSWSKRFYNE